MPPASSPLQTPLDPFVPCPHSPRVKLLVSADAMPFELFECVYTQEAYHKLLDSGALPSVAHHAAATAPASSSSAAGHHAAAAAHQQQQQRGAHSAPGAAPAAGGGDSSSSSGDLLVDDNLGFSKDRTISRLTEMQSLEYLVSHAAAHEPALALALREALDKQRGAKKAAAGGRA